RATTATTSRNPLLTAASPTAFAVSSTLLLASIANLTLRRPRLHRQSFFLPFGDPASVDHNFLLGHYATQKIRRQPAVVAFTAGAINHHRLGVLARRHDCRPVIVIPIVIEFVGARDMSRLKMFGVPGIHKNH